MQKLVESRGFQKSSPILASIQRATGLVIVICRGNCERQLDIDGLVEMAGILILSRHYYLNHCLIQSWLICPANCSQLPSPLMLAALN